MDSSASPTEAWLGWQRNRSPDWRDFKAGLQILEASFPALIAPVEVSRPSSLLPIVAQVRASQLRGSGGVSPRFPNIPLRHGI
jgi:hypothetical protein